MSRSNCVGSHVLGMPRMGARRELKSALEGYWSGKQSMENLLKTAKDVRAQAWEEQRSQGLSFVTVGDFAYYDHVLNISALLGLVPPRFANSKCGLDQGTGSVSLDTYFGMARGTARGETEAAACEMTKFYDTNYHYIVPEFCFGQLPRVLEEAKDDYLFGEVEEAKALGHKALKATLIGPYTFMTLGKWRTEKRDIGALASALGRCYGQILSRLTKREVRWCQLEEPSLVLNMVEEDINICSLIYGIMREGCREMKILLTPYFGSVVRTSPENKLGALLRLPVDGLHVDLIRDSEQLAPVLEKIPEKWVLSVGVIDGRNVWRADLEKWTSQLLPVAQQLKERLWVGTSCSLFLVPEDAALETQLDDELRSWLSFAKQKVAEVHDLSEALSGEAAESLSSVRKASEALASKKLSERSRNERVRQRVQKIRNWESRAACFEHRYKVQREAFRLPLYPTTTIGSFPQTPEIRKARLNFKKQLISEEEYSAKMRQHIKMCVERQEALKLDVLVHGEPERNDMVEYFGELLEGMITTQHGWVQSYGSRCVKPPIIYGDVSRPRAMTVHWIKYAQSLTQKLVKGMLTGPVTIMQWSYVRDDMPKKETCKQIALALQDEIADLISAGIRVVQVDEPAFREALPLVEDDRPEYLDYAVGCFRLCTCKAPAEVQIHTHMCYSEFNGMMEHIAAMDADVLSIETSRSHMELLRVFKTFKYPNCIGPGVYDIHSPNVPAEEWIVALISEARKYVDEEKIWINPDCGLKTRTWEEVTPSLTNMVSAAQKLRGENWVAQ